MLGVRVGTRLEAFDGEMSKLSINQMHDTVKKYSSSSRKSTKHALMRPGSDAPAFSIESSGSGRSSPPASSSGARLFIKIMNVR